MQGAGNVYDIWIMGVPIRENLWNFCGILNVQIPCGLILIILWKKQRMYQITMERLESLEHKYCDKLSYIW